MITFTLSLSLFDSLSTAQQIIIFVLLLTTDKPLRNSLAFLMGLSGAYLLCGLGGYLALEQLQEFIRNYIPTSSNLSDAQYYLTELLSGVIMTAIGAIYYARNRKAAPSRRQNLMVARLKSMNSLFAGGMGAFISASSFPLAIPYIIALEKYAAADMSFAAASCSILLYNIGYALPMLLALGAYLYASRKRDDINDTMHERTRRLNLQLTTWAWAGVGLFSMADAGIYFVVGRAIVKGRYF